MKILNWLNKTETRGSLANPATWMRTAFGGTSTSSGEKVSTDSALHQPAVFACVRVISEDVASMPLRIYGKGRNGGRFPIDAHPVARLFHTAPNSAMSPFNLMETMQSHMLLYGNSYAEIERNGNGEPVALWILQPEQMQVKVVNGAVVYEYNGKDFTSDKILHLRALGHEGLLGYSPIAYAKETIGISQAMEKSGASFFANSSRPAGVLEHPAKLAEDAAKRLRSSWQAMFSGSENTGRTAILEEGMKWRGLTIPHSDSQWLESRQYALQDIARIYRVPPHMIGDLSNATFSNIESQQRSYLQQTLMPWLRRWEQEINRKLIMVDDRSVYAEFTTAEILRGNTPERFAAYKTARETGWLSVNEIRKMENKNPISGGDSYIQPLNYIDAEIAKEVQAPKAERCDDWFADSVKRAVGIIRNASNRKASKLSDEEWHEWLIHEDFAMREKIALILQPACEKLEVDANGIAGDLLKSHQTTMGLFASSNTNDKLDECKRWADVYETGSGTIKLLEQKESDNED
jgi:HK97 family phage portal protein